MNITESLTHHRDESVTKVLGFLRQFESPAIDSAEEE